MVECLKDCWGTHHVENFSSLVLGIVVLIELLTDVRSLQS